METCFCGGSKFDFFKRPYFLVSEEGKYSKAPTLMECGTCKQCGTIRQFGLPFDDIESMKKYYAQYPPTKKAYSVKSFQSDLEVAKKRVDAYGILPGSDILLLDVGSGSGAFVSACLDRGIKAYGCEIAEYSDGFDRNIYKRAFEEIGFPTDHFDIVTCHDVLEHVLNPKTFIEELARVTKQDGHLYLEIPNFFASEGEHHWKKEHIWYFRPDDAVRLCRERLLKVEEISSPIPSKICITFRKAFQSRPSIIVPPGIGDSYWSIAKIPAFLKARKLPIPDVSVVCPRSKRHNGHQRALPFIEMFPFLNAQWEVLEGKEPENRAIWQEAYAEEGRTIFENVLEHDYFISYNGHLRVGKELDDIDPSLKTEWFPRMFVSLEQEQYKEWMQKKYSRYAVFYFIFQGTYKYWTAQFPISSVAESIKKICEQGDLMPVFVGGKWDEEDQDLQQLLKKIRMPVVNLVGKTSLQQLFGLLRGAEVVVGYPSGLTIMSAVLRQKTFVIWNDYYHRDFFWRAMPPAVRGTTYRIENTYKLSSAVLSANVMGLMEGKDFPRERPMPEELTIKIPAVLRRQEKRPAQFKGSKFSSISVICVLKSGGTYTGDYVQKLFSSIKRNSVMMDNIDYVCLTDMQLKENGFRVLPLKHDWNGWWSKAEIFRPNICASQYAIYFDLDTVIVQDISDLLSYDMGQSFFGLRPWNEKKRALGGFASGVMRWDTKLYVSLYSEFEKKAEDNMQQYQGDQDYFSSIMKRQQWPWKALQDYFPGIYSYKRNCRSGLPKDARIVCFHGNPRPHEMKEAWVLENWK